MNPTLARFVPKPGYIMRPNAAKHIATLLGNENEADAWYRRIPGLIQEGKLKVEEYGEGGRLLQIEKESIEKYVKEISANYSQQLSFDFNDPEIAYEQKLTDMVRELNTIIKLFDDGFLLPEKTIEAIRSRISST